MCFRSGLVLIFFEESRVNVKSVYFQISACLVNVRRYSVLIEKQNKKEKREKEMRSKTNHENKTVTLSIEITLEL